MAKVCHSRFTAPCPIREPGVFEGTRVKLYVRMLHPQICESPTAFQCFGSLLEAIIFGGPLQHSYAR